MGAGRGRTVMSVLFFEALVATLTWKLSRTSQTDSSER